MPPPIKPEIKEEILERVRRGEIRSRIADDFGVTRQCVSKFARENGLEVAKVSDFWREDPARAKMMHDLRADGWSFEQIAKHLTKHFGRYISKNACISRHSRDKCEERPPRGPSYEAPITLPKTSFKPVRLSVGAQHPHMGIVWEAWARKYGVMNYGA